MPIGIMGSKSLALLDWASGRFTRKEREKMNMCLCCFLPPHWNTLGFTQTTVKTTITHNNFRHCPVSFSLFVRQPFSKQLYTSLNCLILKPKYSAGLWRNLVQFFIGTRFHDIPFEVWHLFLVYSGSWCVEECLMGEGLGQGR